MRFTVKVLLFVLTLSLTVPVAADDFDELAAEFWQWRAGQMPSSGDDLPRLERPRGWAPDWSPKAVAAMREQLVVFEASWASIDPSAWSVPRQVDHQLIGSAIARVRWELEITRGWQRNPSFYVHQTLTPIFDELLPPPPFSRERAETLLRLFRNIPSIVEAARENLTDARRPFARIAIGELENVRDKLTTVAVELIPRVSQDIAADLAEAVERAAGALEDYREWLESGLLSEMSEETAVGHDNYVFFLREVALMPYTPEQLLMMGRQEWERSLAFEEYEKRRNQGLAEMPLFADTAAQIKRETSDELAIRRFLEERNILTIPDWAGHYVDLPMPPYLAPLAFLGVTADHTSPSRLNEDGHKYIRPPSRDLGYFALSMAQDPRPIIVHEGVPGHYLQLILGWKHENPIRRHYYDSGANEGIGFYAEEMMLQAGLFDDSPKTREILYNYMRLRALRVEIDVKLALGKFTIAQASRYLQTTVPMDKETADWEAAFFASTPGQAISYQIGKLQITAFLAEARRREGEGFSLRRFHDYLWKNGNLPIATQMKEYLSALGAPLGEY